MEKIFKKARVAVSLIDIYAYIFYAFLIFFVVLLFGIRSCSMGNSESAILKSNVEQTDANLILSNLLRTPVILDFNNPKSEITISDLIILWKSDKSYEVRLKNELNSILSSSYKRCVVFCIDNTQFLVNDCFLFIPECEDKYSQLIPDLNREIIEVSINPSPTAVKEK